MVPAPLTIEAPVTFQVKLKYAFGNRFPDKSMAGNEMIVPGQTHGVSSSLEVLSGLPIFVISPVEFG